MTVGQLSNRSNAEMTSQYSRKIQSRLRMALIQIVLELLLVFQGLEIENVMAFGFAPEQLRLCAA